jgi:hypothetical protein
MMPQAFAVFRSKAMQRGDQPSPIAGEASQRITENRLLMLYAVSRTTFDVLIFYPTMTSLTVFLHSPRSTGERLSWLAFAS